MVDPLPIIETGEGSRVPRGEGKPRPGLRLLRESQKPKGDAPDKRDKPQDGDDKRRGAPKEQAFESFEALKAQPKQLARYLIIRDRVQKMFVALESQLAAGDKVIEMRQKLLEVAENEPNADKKKKIQELLKANPLDDKSDLIKQLQELYKDDPKRSELFKRLLG